MCDFPCNTKSSMDDSDLSIRELGTRFAYWLLAHSYFLPGLYLQRYSTLFGLLLAMKRSSHVPKSLVSRLLNGTLESTTYFEFDFAWRSLAAGTNAHDYLDVLSPWLLPLLLIQRRQVSTATVVNDVRSTLRVLQRLLDAASIGPRCNIADYPLAEGCLHPESFDVITSMSGPARVKDDSALTVQLWKLLRPGGRLIISLPCAAAVPYRMPALTRLEDGATSCTFDVPRYYDSRLIEEHVFSVVGEPDAAVVYGEIRSSKGPTTSNASIELSSPPPQEPVNMACGWRCFPRLEDLPGNGVIAMMFTKPSTSQPATDAKSA